MKNITPCLWFDTEAEEAVAFYVSVFKNSKIGKMSYYSDGMHRPKGMVMTVSFELNGQPYLALNGGPDFPFTEAISLTVGCENQAEIDEYWKKLTADGGKEVQCGWLKDKYGLSWQIAPANIGDLISDPKRSAAVMKAVMGMVKLDIAKITAAYDGKS